MVQMATPWEHPETSTYCIRRQIPEALRCAFAGKALHKISLRTKNRVDAARLLAQANAAFEAQLEVARRRLAETGLAGPSPRDKANDLVLAYFEGPATSEGGLEGPERLLLPSFEVGCGISSPEEVDPKTRSISFRWFQPSSDDRWEELLHSKQTNQRGIIGSEDTFAAWRTISFFEF